MKLKTLFLFLLLAACSANLYAQTSKPKPLDQSFFNLIEGSWAGESEMMGVVVKEELNCHMDHNRQFLFVNLRAATEDKSHTYSGTGVYGSDVDGNVTSWWFDDYGISNVATGSGKIDANKIILDSKNDKRSMNRTLELTGGHLVMKWTSTMKDRDGKDETMTGETIYTKLK